MNEEEHDQSADDVIAEVIRRLDGKAFVRRARAGADPDLLTVLDALLVVDDDPPGFEGSLCIGIRKVAGIQWWLGAFTPTEKVRTGFVRTLPNNIDAALLLGEREANAMLRRQPIQNDPADLIKFGDEKILRTFFDRYLSSSKGVT